MDLKINDQPIAALPSEMTVELLDLDDAESTTRTADGTLNRDRVAVKRQIQMSWNALTMAQISALLKQMSGVFFQFRYPDPMAGVYTTKTMYVGNRPAPMAMEKNGVIYWNGLKVTLTEK
ncbi:hypothetical protein HGI30_16715 [Paenibacillus albicereus]|uniref:Prophage protein n=1 Tax=Paenibacillus albicereus TaxID=2726185 RepID=A0A6H2H040_9BACL|nr:DUF6711 family protein [Paenibacillus albicereus]QJC53053.1 hypothetical protein HGI30_16715 [Paenibacillus albicereus]